MVAVAITRDGHDAASLRRAASSIRDADAARRMLTLALILDGRPRSEAAALCGMERQTLRDWVHRYNAEGLAGLSDRRGAVGPRPRLSPEQRAAVAELVRAGPDPAEHGVVHWRQVDLAAVIKARRAKSRYRSSPGAGGGARRAVSGAAPTISRFRPRTWPPVCPGTPGAG